MWNIGISGTGENIWGGGEQGRGGVSFEVLYVILAKNEYHLLHNYQTAVKVWKPGQCKPANIHTLDCSEYILIGIVQRILTVVETEGSYNPYCRPFSYRILKGHHPANNVKPFSAA
jgi:hypothetical protein